MRERERERERENVLGNGSPRWFLFIYLFMWLKELLLQFTNISAINFLLVFFSGSVLTCLLRIQ